MTGSRIWNPVAMQKIAELRAARDGTEKAWNKHRMVCGKCSRAGLTSAVACNDGWELAMERARARNRWADRERISADCGEQSTLF